MFLFLYEYIKVYQNTRIKGIMVEEQWENVEKAKLKKNQNFKIFCVFPIHNRTQ